MKNLAAPRLAGFEYSSSRVPSIPRISVIFFSQKNANRTLDAYAHMQRCTHVHTNTRDAYVEHETSAKSRSMPARISGGFL